MDQWLDSGWNTFFDDFSIPHVVVIAIATIIIFGLSLTYYLQNRNYKVGDRVKTFSLGMESIVNFIKKMVVESFGPRWVKLTPYFIFLFLFLVVLNVFAIFGIKEATTSYTVPLTLGLFTWFSSMFCAIKFQKFSYLNKLCFCISKKGTKIPILPNPIAVLGEFTPLISISFRLWGNIIAGAILYSVMYWALGSLSSNYAYISIIVGGVIVMPMMMGYLSLFIGLIQAYVFTLLSITYISSPIKAGEQIQQEKLAKKSLKEINR